jgi:hypothetical protein
LCASESTSEFERLAMDYITGRVKKGIRGVHHSHRIRIHDLIKDGQTLMTEQQLYIFSGLALVLSIVTALFTRATLRRIVGAMAGAAAAGIILPVVIALGETAHVWHMAIDWRPYMLALLIINVVLCAYALLITWRIARRFGWRGLVMVGVAVAIIGPPRDYWYMARFPEWGYYAPGFAPVIAISMSYVTLMLIGYGVMRLVAGPARKDPLARRAWAAGKR